MWAAISLSLAAVLYNNVVNRWQPFHRYAYVPANLGFTIGLVALGSSTIGLSREELGLTGDLEDLALPCIALALFGIGALTVSLSAHGHRIADRRVADLSQGEVAYHVFLRIPLGTAVTEEIVFRGLLYAAFLNAGNSRAEAAFAASVAFGLWHVSPTLIGLRMNRPGASRRVVYLVVMGAVIATTVAGVALTWLRIATGGLVAPIILHAGVNSIGVLAATTAARRRRSTTSTRLPRR